MFLAQIVKWLLRVITETNSTVCRKERSQILIYLSERNNPNIFVKQTFYLRRCVNVSALPHLEKMFAVHFQEQKLHPFGCFHITSGFPTKHLFVRQLKAILRWYWNEKLSSLHASGLPIDSKLRYTILCLGLNLNPNTLIIQKKTNFEMILCSLHINKIYNDCSCNVLAS